MSQMPFVVRNVRFGTVLGQKHEFEDSLWLGLVDTHCGLPMGATAEKLGAQFGITRKEVDEFALRSQQTWKAGMLYYIYILKYNKIGHKILKLLRKSVFIYLANDAGYFKAEIAPVTLKSKRGEVSVTVDEHPRPQTKIEDLSKLPSIFQKDGLVTAGTASVRFQIIIFNKKR